VRTYHRHQRVKSWSFTEADGTRLGQQVTPLDRVGIYVPGGKAWTASSDGSGWIVYLFAAVALVVGARAMRGGKVALRALIAIALILFLERSFTPFSMREQDPIVLALHAVGAFVSLAVALVTASVIRGGPSPHRASVPKLEAA